MTDRPVIVIIAFMTYHPEKVDSLESCARACSQESACRTFFFKVLIVMVLAMVIVMMMVEMMSIAIVMAIARACSQESACQSFFLKMFLVMVMKWIEEKDGGIASDV